MGQPGQLVGVGVGRVAPVPQALQLAHRPHPADEQEPHARVGERGLYRRRGVPRHREHDRANREDGERAVHVADHHEYREQQRQCQPQQQGDPAGGEQHGTGDAQQRRGEVAGEQREHHARSGRPAPGQGEPGRVGVQPDPAQPPAGEQRDQGVAAFMRDRDGVTGHPPNRPGYDRDQPDHGRGQNDRARGSGLRLE